MASTVTANCRSNRRSNHNSAQRDRQSQASPNQPQLMLIAATQRIIDAMDDREIKPMEVKINQESYINAYPVTMDEAREWCEKCRKQLCTCDDKFAAPFILAWKVRRKGKRVVPLRRAELPISIPRRRA